MLELSLFSGGGGGIYASKLLGHRIVGYVESNEYCQKVIRQRIDDGIFDEGPIFDDIETFNSQGYAKSYQGMVDLISGGFPCQDISCAGGGKGIFGNQSSLWFDMAATVSNIRPRFVFIENSPALLVRGFESVINNLSEMGYNAAWCIISAADLGAPHLRKRLWILGYSSGERWKARRKNYGKHDRSKPCSDGEHTFSVADTDSNERKTGHQQRIRWNEQGQTLIDKGSLDVSDTGCALLEIGKTKKKHPTFERKNITGQWWTVEPRLGRVVNGLADRVKRIEALGNGQVPVVAAYSFVYLKTILERFT